MTNMRNYEQYADECTGIFMKTMDAMENKVFDFGVWAQYYAFDVIAMVSCESGLLSLPPPPWLLWQR